MTPTNPKLTTGAIIVLSILAALVFFFTSGVKVRIWNWRRGDRSRIIDRDRDRDRDRIIDRDRDADTDDEKRRRRRRRIFGEEIADD